MDNDSKKFTFLSEDGKEIECELVLSFYIKNKDKNYMLFTDHTYDEDKNLKIYVYYNTSKDETLIPVTDDKEFEIIENIYKNIQEGVNW